MLDETYQPASRENSRIRVCAEPATPGVQPREIWLHEVRDGDDVGIVANVDANEDAVEGRGFDVFAAWEKLQQRLSEAGVQLRCCGNCRYLQLTGKSRQMSFGAKGYCLRYCREQGRSREDVVSIYDSCDEFIFGSQSFIQEIQAAWQTERRNVEASQQEDTDHGTS